MYIYVYIFFFEMYIQGEADKVLQQVCDKMAQIQENFLCVFCYWCHGLLKCNFFLGRHGSPLAHWEPQILKCWHFNFFC